MRQFQRNGQAACFFSGIFGRGVIHDATILECRSLPKHPNAAVRFEAEYRTGGTIGFFAGEKILVPVQYPG
jgi:hypothetical protein